MTFSTPDFDDLPAVPGMPQGCAWGIFDKDGKKDLLGTLNLLTPDVVAAACKEARDGVSVSLNWPLNASKVPMPGRIDPAHKVMTLQATGLSQGVGWDDEISFNTQKSSQWDSLVHWAHQPTQLSYNGVAVTKEALSASTSRDNTTPTLDHWHAAGGLVARGVLLDYKAWYEATAGANPPYHPFNGHRISVADLEAIAAHQGVELRHGDVLVVRTGTTEVLEAPTAEDFAKMASTQIVGVHGSVDTARWIWNRRFAAVAGDAMAFEALPPLDATGEVAGIDEMVLHPWLLAMFGMPIGELWDLKALAAHCKSSGRYSFLLTSVPLNLPGLVGSPPNALAIF
ncbi:hypothetical protein ACN47E_010199 [Coniothyrium glycines]